MRKWIKLNKFECKEILWSFTDIEKRLCPYDNSSGFWLVKFKNKRSIPEIYYHWSSWNIWYSPFSNSLRLYLNLLTKHESLKNIEFDKIIINKKFFDTYTIESIVLNKKIKINIFKYE